LSGGIYLLLRLALIVREDLHGRLVMVKKKINIQQDASWPDDIIMHWAKFWFQKICTCKD